MRGFCILLLMTAFFSTCFAQDVKKVRQAFFPNPELTDLNTPVARKRMGYTSYKEMVHFLKQKAANNPSLLSLEVAGRTQRGRDIYGVRIADDSQPG
ncbi:MAG: hypothetical protein ACRCSQ_04380, partial [Bacteroidales bacterium]